MPVETFFQAYVDALSDPAPEPPRVVPGEHLLCIMQCCSSLAFHAVLLTARLLKLLTACIA